MQHIPPPAPSANPYGIAEYQDKVAYQGAPTQNELVSGQLNQLLADQNPYIKQAVAQSQAQAAGRGLLNGSMAAGAGVNAAIANALPIAQGNAQEYANTAQANQMASNQQLGAATAADAQTTSAGIMAGATLGSAQINAATQAAAQKLQYQIAGQQLGFNYAQLGQQGTQFNAQLGQAGSEFNANLAQQGSQFNAQLAQSNQQFGATLNNQQTEFQQTQALNIGEYQNNESFAQYQLGMQMQNNSQNAYGQIFSSIMMNPNMTAADRQAALQNANQFYSGMAQQNASLPAFVPGWVNDPNYWTQSWTTPTTPAH
jgi:hypothetical protein